MEDFVNQIKGHLYERISSSFYFTFLFSWIYWNYPLIIHFFSSESANLKITAIGALLNKPPIEILFLLILYPSLSAIFVNLFFPLIDSAVFTWTHSIKSATKYIKAKIDRKSILTAEEKDRITAEVLRIQSEAASYSSKLVEENGSLISEISTLTNNINTKNNEIKQANDKLLATNQELIDIKAKFDTNSNLIDLIRTQNNELSKINDDIHTSEQAYRSLANDLMRQIKDLVPVVIDPSIYPANDSASSTPISQLIHEIQGNPEAETRIISQYVFAAKIKTLVTNRIKNDEILNSIGINITTSNGSITAQYNDPALDNKPICILKLPDIYSGDRIVHQDLAADILHEIKRNVIQHTSKRPKP